VIAAAVAAAALALGAPSAAAPASDLSQAVAPTARGTTRVQATVRPFLSVIGAGFGGIADLVLEHQFPRPWKVGVEMAPLAVIAQRDGAGAITHLRATGAFSSEMLELGLGFGARLQRWGPSGYSTAAKLRLGTLDGLRFELGYVYSIYRSWYTDRVTYGFSNATGALVVPVSARVALTLDGGFAYDLWAYTTLGLRHRLRGDGGPGTLILGGSFGLAWVLDRLPCLYGDPTPCKDAAWGFGPTVAVTLDRRF